MEWLNVGSTLIAIAIMHEHLLQTSLCFGNNSKSRFFARTDHGSRHPFRFPNRGTGAPVQQDKPFPVEIGADVRIVGQVQENVLVPSMIILPSGSAIQRQTLDGG